MSEGEGVRLVRVSQRAEQSGTGNFAGGFSIDLRAEEGMPGPGDVRQCQGQDFPPFESIRAGCATEMASLGSKI